ncbi:MAG: tryptophan 7-halogenase [Gammaproteobacteria bacterium]|nr:tryptophan 7-halogenase [Gammaproteobacteria bacterium]
MSEQIRRVVIVGGGSAGWLAAGVIAADHQIPRVPGLEVTLVESPAVSPIGVGEGTWPSMRDTLRRIGVSETDFIRECDAAFKQGSRFGGWTDGGGEHYYHPFSLPQGYGEANLVTPWLREHGAVPFAELVSCQPQLCERGRAPKQVTTPEYAAVANYAYHLDAGRFGPFLQRHCTARLGVRHVLDHVTRIEACDNGDLAAVVTGAHGRIEGDLFIDCTGFSSLLLGQHYGVPLVTVQPQLFNDSALAVQVPYAAADAPIASHTIATACAAGWIWDIGLQSRRGVGHVYSSAHMTDEQAERILREYVAAGTDARTAAALAPRKLSFRPGYRASLWQRNCVAVGLAAGFVEPLEASALALVEFSATMISEQLPATRALMETVAARFNDAFRYRWERALEFLKLHYLLSGRSDSPYWIEHRAAATVPPRLAGLLELWRHQPPSRYDFHRIEEIFPAASYQYVLYGMGFRPESGARPESVQNAALAQRCFAEAAALGKSMLAALPANRALLNHLQSYRLQRI